VTLTAREIAEITRLLEDSSFDELQLEIDGLKLHLKRGAPVAAQPAKDSEARIAAAVSPETPVAPGAGEPSDARNAARAKPAVAAGGDLEDVPAPMLGTFYRAPKPGEQPFVEVGSLVEPDTIIGIIEVMKLMNTVRAGVRGTVAEISGRDGALVEYGETLLRVRRSSES
jgi:acetyl-CoA carboxylase biotin carboxyl carrier protein